MGSIPTLHTGRVCGTDPLNDRRLYQPNILGGSVLVRIASFELACPWFDSRT